MQYGRIAGPYGPLYPEVISKLNEEVPGYAARWIYVVLVGCFRVDEVWGDDPDWISGIIRATKVEIMEKSGVSKRSGGFRIAWDQLMGSSLVEEQPDKSLVLPFFKKKAYDSISPREIRDRLSRLEDHMQADQGDVVGQKGPLRGNEDARTPIKPSEDVPLRGQNAENGKKREMASSRPSDIYLKGPKKENSLSTRTVISGFYTGIGQKKISKEKRERGNRILKKLRDDGFSLEDISFAVKWTLENAKEEPYDFAIIEHTISQAIAAREKEEARDKEIEEREDQAAKEKEEKEREEKEREEINTYKESLSDEERAELREKALTKIKASGGFKKQFITDTLIEIMENRILQRGLVEKGND